MTTMKCRCGNSWTEGPARDIKTAVCRLCLQHNLNATRAELEGVKIRLEHACQDADKNLDERDIQGRRAEAAEARAEALRVGIDGLLPFISHRDGCTQWLPQGCDCGLEESQRYISSLEVKP